MVGPWASRSTAAVGMRDLWAGACLSRFRLILFEYTPLGVKRLEECGAYGRNVSAGPKSRLRHFIKRYKASSVQMTGFGPVTPPVAKDAVNAVTRVFRPDCALVARLCTSGVRRRET